MNKCDEPPGNKYFLPPPKEVLKRNNIYNRTFSDVSVIDETES